MPGFPKIYDDLGGFWMLEEKLRYHWRKTIYPVLEVNDNPIIDHSRYSFNLQQLLLSRKKPGRYELIIPDRGYNRYKDQQPKPVQVSHHPTHISWHLTSPGLERIYHFDKEQYGNTAEQLKKELRGIIRQYHASIKDGAIIIQSSFHVKHYPFIQDLAKKYRIYDYEFNFDGGAEIL